MGGDSPSGPPDRADDVDGFSRTLQLQAVPHRPAAGSHRPTGRTAAALRCLGGEIQARLRFRNDEERRRAEAMGGDADETRVYRTADLASGANIVFAATGVTTGDLLQGVRFFGGGARTHSLVVTDADSQVRFVDTVHMFDRQRPPSVRL